MWSPVLLLLASSIPRAASECRDSPHQVLYCTVLYCTVLYCTVLHCTALYCTVRDSPHQARLCGLAPARGYCDLYPDWARLHCPASCSLCPPCSCQVTQESRYFSLFSVSCISTCPVSRTTPSTPARVPAGRATASPATRGCGPG